MGLFATGPLLYGPFHDFGVALPFALLQYNMEYQNATSLCCITYMFYYKMLIKKRTVT